MPIVLLFSPTFLPYRSSSNKTKLARSFIFTFCYTDNVLSLFTDKLYHIMLYRVHLSSARLTTLVVIGADYIGSRKSSYHTITNRYS
jgi:hypothetical protein